MRTAAILALVLALYDVPALLRGQCDYEWTYMRRPGVGYPSPATCVHQGKVYVSDQPATSAGKRARLGRWDGEQWENVLDEPLDITAQGWIKMLANWDDELVAFGDFVEIGGVSCSGCAAWDGAHWRCLECPYSLSSPYATATYQSDLYVAIDVGIIRFHGTTWERLSIAARALQVYEGKLVIGGHFSSLGGVPAQNIGTWDGEQFAPLGALGLVSGLAVAGGKLYAAGSPAVAVWDGVAWQALPNAPAVKALAGLGNKLIVGGNIGQVNGQAMHNITAWNGTGWEPLGSGLDGEVARIVPFGSEVIVSGNFRGTPDLRTNYIAAWNGHAWRTLGNGFQDGPPEQWAAFAFALAWFDGDLVVAGRFTHAGGRLVNNIARYDGQQWHPLGAGANGGISHLAVYDGELYAAGDFTEIGGAPAATIARWNGATWQPLGTGLEPLAPLTSVMIGALTVYDDQLVVAGTFGTAGGVPVGGVALWDGEAWHAPGAGIAPNNTVPPWIRTAAAYDGRLVVGGAFSLTSNVPDDNLAAWDGAGWGVFNGGADGTVDALGTLDDDLFVGGTFDHVGTLPAARLAYWDGAAWQAFDDGLVCGSDSMLDGKTIRAFMPYSGQLLVAGEVVAANDEPAYGLARWDGTWHATGIRRNGHKLALLAQDMTLYVGSDHGEPAPFGGYTLACYAPRYLPGDMNCDGAVTFGDIDRFVAALGQPGPGGWPYVCPWRNADCNRDNGVTFADIDPFVAQLGKVCR